MFLPLFVSEAGFPQPASSDGTERPILDWEVDTATDYRP